MRITDHEIESIRKLAPLHFGLNAQVFLFGSRTNNQRRGGDIHLFIRNSDMIQLKIRAKINFITELILLIGDQKIDVVLDYPGMEGSAFYTTINQTGIQLC